MLCVSKGALCVLPSFHTNPAGLCNKICDSYVVDKETETQGDVTFFKGLTSKTQTWIQVSWVWVLFSPPRQPLRLWGLNMFPSHPLERHSSLLCGKWIALRRGLEKRDPTTEGQEWGLTGEKEIYWEDRTQVFQTSISWGIIQANAYPPL